MGIEELRNLNFNYNLTFKDLKQMPVAFAQRSWEFLKVNRSIFIGTNVVFMAIASVPLFAVPFSNISILKDRVLYSVAEISKINIVIISWCLGLRFLFCGEDIPILTLELKRLIFFVSCKTIWKNDLNALKQGYEKFLSLPDLSAEERLLGHEAYIAELEKRGQHEEIVSYCQQKLLLIPNNPPELKPVLIYYIKSLLCLNQNDLNALKEGCEKFLSLPNLSAEERYRGHEAYITELEKRRQHEEIVSYCQEKLSLAPNNPPELKLILVAYYIDSLICLNQNDLNALKEGCEKFLSLPNLSVKERYQGHEAYITELKKRGQHEEIISYCEEKLLLAPNSQPELKLILCLSYIHSLRHLNRFEESIEFMRAVLLEFPDLTFLNFNLKKNEFYHTLINNLISLNRWSEVKEASKEAIGEFEEEAHSDMEEDGAPISFLDFYIESFNKAKRMLQVADERASLYRRESQSVDGKDPKTGITFRRKRT